MGGGVKSTAEISMEDFLKSGFDSGRTDGHGNGNREWDSSMGNMNICCPVETPKHIPSWITGLELQKKRVAILPSKMLLAFPLMLVKVSSNALGTH